MPYTSQRCSKGKAYATICEAVQRARGLSCRCFSRSLIKGWGATRKKDPPEGWIPLLEYLAKVLTLPQPMKGEDK